MAIYQMFKFFTSKNEKDFYIFLIISVMITGIFLILAGIGKYSFFNYHNRLIAGFYNAESDFPKLYSSRLSDNLTIIIIDGLGAADALRLSSFSALKKYGASCTVKIYEPSFDTSSKATILTGARPENHSILDPEQDSKKTFKLCENLFSLCKKSNLKTAFFGSHEFEKFWNEYPSDSFFNDIAPNNANLPEIDAEIASGAISFITSSKPNFSIISLPGLARTARLFGLKSREYSIHLEKLDAVISKLAKTLMINNNYLMLVSSHGHVPNGGYGGPEPEAVETPLIILGPDVKNDSLSNVCVRYADICPTASGILGLPPAFLNEGSFLGQAFTISEFLKCAKAEAVVRQKSEFYSRYNKALSFSDKKIFNCNAIIDEINKNSRPRNFHQKTVALEVHEKSLDMEFEAIRRDARSGDRIYRSIYLSIALLSLFIFLIMKYHHPFKLFAATTQIIVFYCIYYWMYFYNGYNFSLSDFNFLEGTAPFMKNRDIEICSAYMLSTIPLLLNYFLYNKSLATWINHIFIPVFLKFNLYLIFIITAQCFLYIALYGVSISYMLPDMSWALKYCFDVRMLVVSQITSLAVISLSYLGLMAFGRIPESRLPSNNGNNSNNECYTKESSVQFEKNIDA